MTYVWASMDKEECSVCGKEFDVRDMLAENEVEIGETRSYADISKIPHGIDDEYLDEIK